MFCPPIVCIIWATFDTPVRCGTIPVVIPKATKDFSRKSLDTHGLLVVIHSYILRVVFGYIMEFHWFIGRVL